MNCRAFDDLLDRLPPGSTLPPEARLHLEHCARCRALAAAFDEIPGMERIDYSRFAAHIPREFAPVRPLAAAGRVWPWLAVAGGMIAVAAALATGGKGWLARSALERAGMLGAVFAAIASAAWLGALEMEPGRNRWRAVRMLAGLAPVVLVILALALFRRQPDTAFTSHAAACIARGAATALLALAAMWTIARRGVFTEPVRAGIVFGSLAALCGFLSQELYCPVLDSAHVAAAHAGLVILAPLAGWLVAHAARPR